MRIPDILRLAKRSAERQRRMHAILAVLWLLAAFPLLLTSLANSVAVVVFISVYANVVGHWSAVQASKAEEMVIDEVEAEG